MLKIQAARESDSDHSIVIWLIINYTFVPGTDDRVFEEGDRDALLNLPYGADMNRMNKALNDLTDLTTKDAEGNLGTTRRNSQHS